MSLMTKMPYLMSQAACLFLSAVALEEYLFGHGDDEIAPTSILSCNSFASSIMAYSFL